MDKVTYFITAYHNFFDEKELNITLHPGNNKYLISSFLPIPKLDTIVIESPIFADSGKYHSLSYNENFEFGADIAILGFPYGNINIDLPFVKKADHL